MAEDKMAGWHHRLNRHMSLSKPWEMVMVKGKTGVLQSMGSQRG